MTPLLLLALLATPTTPPVTIHTTTTNHQEAPMAQGTPSPGGHPPVFTPRGPNRPAGTTFQRIGTDANNPPMSGGARPAHGNTLAATGRNLTPTEHTARPTPR